MSSASDSSIVEQLGSGFIFVNLLKAFPQVLCKSHTPAAKKCKEEVVSKFILKYEYVMGKTISKAQMMKKINNMKTSLKKKSDMKQTGNKKIVLKEWEKEQLQILDGDSNEPNPTVSRIPGACTVGVARENEKVVSQLPKTDVQSSVSQSTESLRLKSATFEKKRQKLSAETKETRGLTNSELQRLVLLEQLKLIRMKQNQFIEKRAPETNVVTDLESYLSYRVLD